MKRISEHMEKTGEWGEFFPIKYSPFAYNDSLAQEYFPLSKEEVLKNAWSWYEEEESVQNDHAIFEIADTIADVGKEILSKTLICQKTGKPYRIGKEELRLYKKFEIPIPRVSFSARHNARFSLRNPRRLNRRFCDCCRQEMDTSFPKNITRKVYCKECYQAQVA